MDPAALRRDYADSEGLTETDLAPDWVGQFERWFADAVAAGLPEPNAMVLATASSDGRPSARTVLLKGYDQRGLVFYTNYASRKGGDLLRHRGGGDAEVVSDFAHRAGLRQTQEHLESP